MTVLRVAVADRHPAAEGIMERTARMCPRTLAARVGLRMDGSLTIIHLKMYASMVVEQAVEPPMGKTENPAATVRRRLAEQGRPLMYPKRRTKLELEEMAGTGGGGGGWGGGGDQPSGFSP